MSVPENEKIFALIDTTVFGSASDGILLGQSGIYWKNAFTPPQSASWGRIKKIKNKIVSLSNSELQFIDDKIYLAGSGVLADNLKHILLSISSKLEDD